MKCVKCSKKTGATINDLCFSCSEAWDFIKVQFKHVFGKEPDLDDFGLWVFDEETFNKKLLNNDSNRADWKCK